MQFGFLVVQLIKDKYYLPSKILRHPTHRLDGLVGHLYNPLFQRCSPIR